MPWSDYPFLGVEIARTRKHFLAPFADNQTLSEIECSNHHPSLSTLGQRDWAVARWNDEWYIYIVLYALQYNIYIWNWNMKFFCNETLNFLFRKFWVSYILDLAKTVWALQILSQKPTRNLEWKSFEHWGMMYLWICYLVPVISQGYMK